MFTNDFPLRFSGWTGFYQQFLGNTYFPNVQQSTSHSQLVDLCNRVAEVPAENGSPDGIGNAMRVCVVIQRTDAKKCSNRVFVAEHAFDERSHRGFDLRDFKTTGCSYFFNNGLENCDCIVD